jgi:hypothetical protein
MNIHLPAILGFTRYQGFDPSPYWILSMAILESFNPGVQGQGQSLWRRWDHFLQFHHPENGMENAKMVPFLSKIPIESHLGQWNPYLSWIFLGIPWISESPGLKPMNQVCFLPHRSHVASLNPILPGDESVPRALQRDISGPVEVQLPDIFYRTKREREKWLATYFNFHV